jgi:glycosyltransferase involved in cell wall biosynthesis
VTCGERVIVVSNAVRNYVITHYPRCPADKLHLIYRGIDPREFPRDHRPHEQWLTAWYGEHPLFLDKRVITMAGRLTRLKGHHDFLQIIKALRARGDNVHGLIVGGEDPKRRAYARELYEQVERDGLGADISFAGHRSDLRDIYAVSDAVVSLSRQPESFGRTVLEPLSEGVPVVGYAHGGVAEILDAMYPSGAVPVGDTDAAVNALHEILAGGAPTPVANADFLLSNMCDNTLALYADLLASPR